MRHLTYLALLAGCLLGTAPLELVLRSRVYARWRRLLLALVPGLVVGIGWDAYAIHHGQWSFDRRYLVGVFVGGLPLEEALFFVVIPVCAVLTFEAVRRQRPGWLAGDEPGVAEPGVAEPGVEPGAAEPATEPGVVEPAGEPVAGPATGSAAEPATEPAGDEP